MAGTPDDSLCYLPQPRVTKGLFDAKPQPGTDEVRVALTRVNNWSLLKILYIAITAVLQIKRTKRISPGFSTAENELFVMPGTLRRDGKREIDGGDEKTEGDRRKGWVKYFRA
ncbi:hypothetical protein E1301_Tti003211 [Triplophysa tibetana]|uniref:Uncharacterized protein n=1 Tax=Triplophysa tibetana TaxID=1572043 RepID=A0A5A9PMY0_9TELE|nr:hypothetical protein E1301_Tti003211 [Triplophysa tibetana]